ncbi:MAG: HAD-IB family hydrolase [Dermatophilaceae bacterium]
MTTSAAPGPTPPPAGEPRTSVAAFFDLDGTLIPGSANIPLAKAAFARGLMPKRDLFLDLVRGVRFVFIGASDEGSATVRDSILRRVAGHRAAEVAGLADDFLADLVGTVRPEMRAVLDEHRTAGHHRVLVSASPTEIVQRFAAETGMSYGAGTTSEIDAEGRYTGRLAGPFCYKEGKAQVLLDLAAAHGYDLARCYAYSDSISDLPMMRIVGHPVAVNPDHELRRHALDEGWTIVDHGSLRGRVASVVETAKATGRRVTAGARASVRVTQRSVGRSPRPDGPSPTTAPVEHAPGSTEPLAVPD